MPGSEWNTEVREISIQAFGSLLRGSPIAFRLPLEDLKETMANAIAVAEMLVDHLISKPDEEDDD